MPATAITFGNTSVDLKSAPIKREWIRRGDPVARNAVLSRSADRTACTLIWDCTPGEFEWHYDVDETIHILEGSIVLDDGVTPARRLGPGDVVFFPAGAVVHWIVESHVRKLAFFRRQLPVPLAMASRAIVKAKGTLRGLRRPSDESTPAVLVPAIMATTAAAAESLPN